MSKHRIQTVIEVDDIVLEEHDGDAAPPPNDVSEWTWDDLVAAIDQDIVTFGDIEEYDPR